MKSVFVHKKRLWQVLWMLKFLRIKRDMKASSIKGGRNLKGYKLRGVFQKLNKKKHGIKLKKAMRGYEDLGREKNS